MNKRCGKITLLLGELSLFINLKTCVRLITAGCVCIKNNNFIYGVHYGFWFGIDENRVKETDLVSCKYGKYPEDYTNIDS